MRLTDAIGAGLMMGLSAFATPALAQSGPVALTAREAGAPLWEVGFGAFGVVAPDYPAANESSFNGLPFPNVTYRGDLFRLNEEAGARVVPVAEPRFEFGVSVDGAFGANSDDNALREGLPDLDILAEIGPELIFLGPQFATGSGKGRLDLALQSRAVFSLDFDAVAYQGLAVEPELRYRQTGLFGGGGTGFLSIGGFFATERLHDYFYEVPEAFALPDRPAFDAGPGYLGTFVSAGISAPLTDRVVLFIGGQTALHAGAANRDSPLFADSATFAGFLGFAYAIWQSDRRAPARPAAGALSP